MIQAGALNRDILRCTTTNVWDGFRSLAHGSVIDRTFNSTDVAPLELLDNVVWGQMSRYLRDQRE